MTTTRDGLALVSGDENRHLLGKQYLVMMDTSARLAL